MSTINNTDLFLVSRAGTNYQVTAADVSAFAGGGGGAVTSFSAGTTGFTPSGATSGAIVLAGSLNVANGGTGATSAAAALTNLLPAQGPNAGKFLTTDGSVASWGSPAGTVTNVTGTLPITVATGTSTPLIGINAATAAAAGAIEIATLAEAATGTDATRALTPESGVPKDASGMTGAAIIPSGTTAQRPATPAAGMQRYNSTGAFWEGRIGSNWAPFDQRFPVVTAVSATVNPEDYVVVTAATQTITLPATPLPGACVTVVVAGTWLDTVVARNGSNIMGLAQDITLDKQYAAMQFTYTDATNGWRLN